jgi:hypothetical protein
MVYKFLGLLPQDNLFLVETMAFIKSLFLVATLVVSVVKCAPTNLRRELEQVPEFVLKYGMYSSSVLNSSY